MSKLKIAVIGAGIFGVTTAIRLARSGFAVHLYEKSHDILTAASSINQYRLHRGYHYPRSLETAVDCLNSEVSFMEEYAGAILDNVEHYYSISRRDSLTSARQFLDFCKKLDLEYTLTDLNLVRRDSVDLCVRVKESLFDAQALRSICWQKLRSLNINVKLSTEADERTISHYDFAVISTYSATNSLLSNFPEAQEDYQFELCEKPVVRLSERFKNKSIVILDGPFMCVDPFGHSGLFVLGNVVHAIYQTNIGKVPVIDDQFNGWLNNGIIKEPPISSFEDFIASGAEFIPELEKAEHVGSMFTIRTVIPHKEETDERLTLVKRVAEKIITIFSGKIGTCVEAANQVVRMICENAGVGDGDELTEMLIARTS